MDIDDTHEEAGFRAELRDWLAAALPTLDWPEPHEMAAKAVFWRRWQRQLFDAGYAGLGWPRAHGGQGADIMRQAILAEELDAAGAPGNLNTLGEGLAGPTIIEFGSEAQQARYLRPILTGEEIWCQLFSEPDAGSDLASLRTTAERVEGGWRINGAKVWTSRAQVAAHGMLLARTGDAPRHKGITYFLLPMDTPGVTITPIRQLTGDAEFNEVRLDDVVIDDDHRIGPVDGGWRVAMATLSYERVALATGRVNTRNVVKRILATIREGSRHDGSPLGTDPHVRSRVADLYGRALMHQLTGQRVLTSMAAGQAPGPESSVGKLFATPLVEELADFALSLAGVDGQLDLADNPAEDWLRLAYQARGTSIAGGTTFIQRNIVAERVLGMPRGR